MTNLLIIILLLFFYDKGVNTNHTRYAAGRHNYPKGYNPAPQNMIGRSPDKSGLKEYIGQYIIVTVTASIKNTHGFSGFLLAAWDDYVEILVFPYNDHPSGNYWSPCIVSIPIDKITSITYRMRNRF